MNAEFIVVGCRAGSPDRGTAASGYLLRTAHTHFLIDCGPGVAQGLGRMHLLAKLDAVIVIHHHADHCADLVALAYHRLFPRKCDPLPLYGPPDLAETLTALDAVFGIASPPTMACPLSTAFVFHPIELSQSFAFNDIGVETLRANHPVPTLALRFPQWGLAYTADGARRTSLKAPKPSSSC